MIVRLKDDDERFGMKKGDVLEVGPYWLDPDKFTVLRRVSDDYDPGCNVYRSQVERIAPKPCSCDDFQGTNMYCPAHGTR